MARGNLNDGKSREERHAKWEKDDPKGAIRAKAKFALDEQARIARQSKPAAKRNQRNNRREY